MPSKTEMKVLIVDDSITVRELMKQQLKEFGIRYLEIAKTGLEGVKVFQSFKPDLVFLDINMPEMNGVEALSKMIELEPKAYIVILSSLGTKEKVNETIERGAKNFLMKPIDNESLERIILEVSQIAN